MTAQPRLAELFREISIPQGGGTPQPQIQATTSKDGDLRLTWDRPHASGHSHQIVAMKIEDIPKIAELLLGIYNKQQRKQQAVAS
jgi:hypothetical protein